MSVPTPESESGGHIQTDAAVASPQHRDDPHQETICPSCHKAPLQRVHVTECPSCGFRKVERGGAPES